jgi:hypothetical protein
VREESEAEAVVDAGRDGTDIPAVAVFVVVRKSSFRLVLESVARRALRSEEVIVGCWCWVAGALEEDGREAVSALVILVAVASAVVDLGWRLKVGDDEGRVIDDALSLLFLASGEGADVRFSSCTAATVSYVRVAVL